MSLRAYSEKFANHKKHILLGLIIGLLALGGGGGLLVARLLDVTSLAQNVAQSLAAATGARIKVAGLVEADMWPSPRIKLREVVVQLPQSEHVLVTAGEVDIGLDWSGVLLGQPQPRAVTISKAKIVASPDVLAEMRQISPAASFAALGGIVIEDSAFAFAVGGREYGFDQLRGTISHLSLGGWLQAQLYARWEGAAVSLRSDLGPLNPMGVRELTVRAAFDESVALAEFAGTAGPLATGWPEGGLNVRLTDPVRAWGILDQAFQLGSPPPFLGPEPVTLAADFLNGKDDKTGAHFVEISDFKLGLGDKAGAGVQGRARWFVDANEFSVAARFSTLNLALWPELNQQLQAGRYKFPLGLTLAYNVQADELSGLALPLKDVVAAGQLKSGTLSVTSLKAVGPGQAKLELKGDISTAAVEQPQLDMQGQVDMPEPGAFFAALLADKTVPVLPKDIRLGFALRGAWRDLSLPNLDITFDGMQAKGQVSLDAQGAYNIRLTTDLLDLSRYFSAGTAPAWVWELPPFKATLLARNLRVGQLSAENVVADVASDGENISLKQVNLRLMDGTSLALNGTLAQASGAPFNFRVRLTTTDLGGLLRDVPVASYLFPFGMARPLPGTLAVDTEWLSDAAGVLQKTSLVTDAGQIAAEVVSQGEAPLEWKFRLRHSRTADFLRHFSFPVFTESQEPLDLTAEGSVMATDKWSVRQLVGSVAGLRVNGAALSLSREPIWQVEGNVSMAPVEAEKFLANFNPGAIAAVILARLNLETERLSWQGERIENARATLRVANGQMEVTGFTGAWRQGVLRLNGLADFTQIEAPSYRGDLSMDAVQARLMAGSRFGVSGEVAGEGQFEAKGSNWADFLASLSGSGDFSMASGRFSGLDIGGLEALLRDRRAQAKEGLPALLARSGQNDILAFGGNFIAENGVVTLPRVRLRTTSGLLEGQLGIDLRAPRMDGQVLLTINGEDKLPPVGVNLSGPLTGLTASFDVAAFERALTPIEADPAVAASAGETEVKQDSAKAAEANGETAVPAKKPEPLPTTVTTAPETPKSAQVPEARTRNPATAVPVPAPDETTSVKPVQTTEAAKSAPVPAVDGVLPESAVILPPTIQDDDGLGLRIVTIEPPTPPPVAPPVLPETVVGGGQPAAGGPVTLPAATGKDGKATEKSDAPMSLDDLLRNVQP